MIEKQGSAKMQTNSPDEILKRYEFVVNAHNEYMSLINKNYEYELVNDAYCRAHNFTRDQIIGKSVLDLWSKEVFDKKIRGYLERCFAGETIRLEESFVFSGERKRYYSVTYYPYSNQKSEVTHVVVVTSDITERKEAELALRESNEKKEYYLNIIQEDLKKASDYVISLLPDEIDDGEIQTKWHIVPSSQLGGDSFGYHWIDKNHFAFYLLDVSGHGVGSALHSVSALNTLKFHLLPNTDFTKPAQVMSALNKSFKMIDHFEMFFTITYCVYNRKKQQLRYCGAGHPPMIIFNGNKKPQKYSSQNIFIGFLPVDKFICDSIDLKGPAEIYLFTDGAYEVFDSHGNMVSIDALEKYIAENRREDGSELKGAYEMLRKINGGQSLDDDYTMLKLKFK